MFFTIHLDLNIMIGLTIASGVLLNPNILSDNIPLTLGNCQRCWSLLNERGLKVLCLMLSQYDNTLPQSVAQY